MHFWRLTEKQRQGKVDWIVFKQAVTEPEMLLVGCLAYHGKWTALPKTNRFKGSQIPGIHRHHIPFLRLVTPDLQRTHTLFIAWHRPKREISSATTVFYEFRERITQTTRAHIMDKGNGVVISSLPTSINDLLTTALNFRVLSLHRGKIEVLGTGTTGHR